MCIKIEEIRYLYESENRSVEQKRADGEYLLLTLDLRKPSI